ncbi:MAG: hypothetical protein EOO88_12810 [Pedobacter sp.]|nr:MAG: hypothetical protein EOO88_12810 [Pedobacter sp.]
MKFSFILVLALLASKLLHAQMRDLRKSEKTVYALALKSVNGSRKVFAPAMYIDSGLIALVSSSLQEKGNSISELKFIKENNWDFIYRKMKTPKTKKAVLLSSKDLLGLVDFDPKYGYNNLIGCFSPVLMNDEKTRAFLIHNIAYQGGSAMYFELKEKNWVLVKREIWLE